MEQIERRLRNITQPKILFSKGVPNISDMADGETRFALVTAQKLRMYVRNGNKLYFTQFNSVEESGQNWEELV